MGAGMGAAREGVRHFSCCTASNGVLAASLNLLATCSTLPRLFVGLRRWLSLQVPSSLKCLCLLPCLQAGASPRPRLC
jgi:hypothetical protein